MTRSGGGGRGHTAENLERQAELRRALQVAAPGDKGTQLQLIYVYANRLGISQTDVDAVHRELAQDDPKPDEASEETG